MQKQSEYYHLRFSECIDKLERELHQDYIGGFYQWADATHGNAWSKAVSRLERAIKLVTDKAISEDDFRVEQALYFERCSELISQYRQLQRLDETDTFLRSLRKGE